MCGQLDRKTVAVHRHFPERTVWRERSVFGVHIGLVTFELDPRCGTVPQHRGRGQQGVIHGERIGLWGRDPAGDRRYRVGADDGLGQQTERAERSDH